MPKQIAILIFDIGKTNKKILLFNQEYNLVYEASIQLAETIDEDGFACEDVHALTDWLKNSFDEILKNEKFDIKAVNFSGYGASFVYLDKTGNIIAPLYNYLKPYTDHLKKQFYNTYGGEKLIAQQTASPILGSLNSGMQLYRLKYEKPELYNKTEYALHLPQYLSFIISKKVATDITSIGCHTMLWNFQKNNYHEWVYKEALNEKLAPVYNSNKTSSTIFNNKQIEVGIGLHDSSSALIPYLKTFNEPFILISTGTWCISLNPFNDSALTDYELNNDCLCYLSYEGKPVKASRLLAGYEHEQQIKKMAAHFNKSEDYYKAVNFDVAILNKIKNKPGTECNEINLNNFSTYDEAYHVFIHSIVQKQTTSTNLILNNSAVKKIFVDGGFSSNIIYMQMLAESFNDKEVYAASVPQASALGAALVIHSCWNEKQLPENLIVFKKICGADRNRTGVQTSLP